MLPNASHCEHIFPLHLTTSIKTIGEQDALRDLCSGSEVAVIQGDAYLARSTFAFCSGKEERLGSSLSCERGLGFVDYAFAQVAVGVIVRRCNSGLVSVKRPQQAGFCIRLLPAF